MTYGKSAVWVIFIAVLAVVGGRKEAVEPASSLVRSTPMNVHRAAADAALPAQTPTATHPNSGVLPHARSAARDQRGVL